MSYDNKEKGSSGDPYILWMNFDIVAALQSGGFKDNGVKLERC